MPSTHEVPQVLITVSLPVSDAVPVTHGAITYCPAVGTVQLVTAIGVP